jgi:hypothetical protein
MLLKHNFQTLEARTHRQDGAPTVGPKFFLLCEKNELKVTEVKHSAIGVMTMLQIVRSRRIRRQCM